jgi:DNA-directed RNA polymerase II subunit RPB3
MQHEDEPTVRIRDLKRDRVNFVLENVDLACELNSKLSRTYFDNMQSNSFANSLRRVIMADIPTVGELSLPTL